VGLFLPISLFPLFFHLPQRFSLNTPPIPHYNYKISFSISTINFLSTNNYSWTHSTVFRGMNSDTLDLGEREGGRRLGGAVGCTAAAIECPLQAACKGRGCIGAAVAVSLRLSTTLSPNFFSPYQNIQPHHQYLTPIFLTSATKFLNFSPIPHYNHKILSLVSRGRHNPPLI
jgi:hypothetical protein